MGNSLLEWLPLFLFAFSYSKKIDLPAAHHRFAQRDKWCVVHCAMWIVRDKWCVSLTGGIWSTHDQGTQSINIFWNELNLKSWSLKHTTIRDVTSGWYSPVLQTSTFWVLCSEYLFDELLLIFCWGAFPKYLKPRHSQVFTCVMCSPCKTPQYKSLNFTKNNGNDNNYIVLWRWWY